MIEIDFLVLSGLRINDTNVWGIKSLLGEAKCGHPFERSQPGVNAVKTFTDAY